MSRRTHLRNAFETSLTNSVTAGATSIVLDSVSGLSSPGYLCLDPDTPSKREYIKYTSINGSTLEGVTRGLAGGQPATTHDAGDLVASVVPHQIVEDVFSDVEDLETGQATNSGDIATNAGNIATNAANLAAHDGAGGATHPAATGGAAGFMSAADKSKLDGIEAGATADQTDGEIMAAVLANDGPGSTLDSDTVDGYEAAQLRQPADSHGMEWTYTTAVDQQIAGSTYTVVTSQLIVVPADWDHYILKVICLGQVQKGGPTVAADSIDLKLTCQNEAGADVDIDEELNALTNDTQRIRGGFALGAMYNAQPSGIRIDRSIRPTNACKLWARMNSGFTALGHVRRARLMIEAFHVGP